VDRVVRWIEGWPHVAKRGTESECAGQTQARERVGIAVIGARSIAQEICRCADGCKGLVNHSKISPREGVAMTVGCNGSCDGYGCRCFPKPKKRAQWHSTVAHMYLGTSVPRYCVHSSKSGP
jgi:hypothetical protein